MVVIELEPEEATRPSSTAAEEREAARPSSPASPEEQEAEEEEKEEAFEDALTDEQLREGKHDKAIKECTKALELNPSYLKALLRRAEAHEKLEHYDEAIAG
uniref:Uncharacterized protein n=1 Tax=Setaria italica TaxID=4555 RepID=K4AH28_SETIT